MTTENTNNITSRWFELATDAYRTYVKSIVWSQERALEYTKTMLDRSNSFQKEGKGLVEEYTGEVRRSQKIFQEMLNESVKATTDAFRQYRDTTNENLQALNERLNTLQTKVEENIPAATKETAKK